MISVLIPLLDDEPALLDTIAALAPAVAEGVVRDLWLATPLTDGYAATVADAAGCGLVEAAGTRFEMLARAAREARSPWSLVLEPGLVPTGGWMAEAADFVSRAEDHQTAVFTLAPRGGRSRLIAALANWQASLLGRGRPEQGLIVSTARLVKRQAPPRAVRLASLVVDRRVRARA